MREVDAGGSYRLLRIHVVDGQVRCLFRLIAANGGVTYHDAVLSRSLDSRFVMEDIYLFSSGEMMSASIRRLVLSEVAEFNPAAIPELPYAQKVSLDHTEKIEQLSLASRNGKAAEAIAIYKSMPDELREQKAIVLVYLKAASNDVREYMAAFQTYRRLFPNDAAVDLFSIAYFSAKRQYDEALRCIEKVDKAVGGDAYLTAQRALILTEAKRYKEAATTAEKAIEQEPDLAETYWSRITVAVKEKNHVDTLTWLKKVVEKAGQEPTDLKDSLDFADFMKSPQHDEWREWCKARRK